MTKIYYFSGTGNSLWSAKRLALLLGDSELFNMAAELRKPAVPIEAGAVVLVFPAYAFQTPLLVRHFLMRAEFRAPYIAVLVTYGSFPGGAAAEVYRILKRKKILLSFAGGIPSVENYIPIFGPPSERKKEKRLALQDAATAAMARAVRERKTVRLMPFRPFSSFVSLLFRLGKPLFVKGFKVTPDCGGCGLCARICPAGAISMTGPALRPVFSARCEHCQGCLNWCPKRAIRYIRLKPDSGRYHHPGVKVPEMVIE
jgi:ferredoxin